MFQRTFLLFSVEWYHPEPINFWMSLYFPLANNPSLPVAWQQFSHLATCLPGSSRHLADLLAICQGTARQLSGLLATLGQPSGQPWHPPETDGALSLVEGPSNGPIRRRRQGQSNWLLSGAGRAPGRGWWEQCSDKSYSRLSCLEITTLQIPPPQSHSNRHYYSRDLSGVDIPFKHPLIVKLSADTAFSTELILESACSSQSHIISFGLLIIIVMLWQSCMESNTRVDKNKELSETFLTLGCLWNSPSYARHVK